MPIKDRQNQHSYFPHLQARIAEAGPIADWCRRVTGHRLFHDAILGAIVFNAIIIGLETAQSLMASYGRLFSWLNAIILSLFLAEISIRLIAEWPHLLRFFRDGWNVFDFTIIMVSLLPETGAFAMVARLARMLRVTRLVSAVPELRLIISTMLRSIPSMGHVILLLGLLLYVYGVLGYYLFHDNDPAHWGTLGTALLTLFQMLTLEGWVEIQKANLAAHPWAWLYFASFIIVTVFVVINLFIAVVINNLEAAKAEQSAAVDALRANAAVLKQITELKERLGELERTLRLQDQDMPSTQDERRTLSYNQLLGENGETSRIGKEPF